MSDATPTVIDIQSGASARENEQRALAAVSQIPASISMTRIAPALVLSAAVEAADALMRVLEKKPNPVMMGGKRYLTVEDWQVVARFYGCAITIVGDESVEYGGARGWGATAALLDADGREVGRAVAMCLDDEEKWSERTSYEWLQLVKPSHAHLATFTTPDGRRWARRADNLPSAALEWEKYTDREGAQKNRPISERIPIGVVKVPSHQLRSMAQTRSAGKIARLNFSFVPALAGCGTTPAEELEPDQLDGYEERNADAPAASRSNPHAQPRREAAPTSTSASTPAPAEDLDRKITKAEGERLWLTVRGSSVTKDDAAAHIKRQYPHIQRTEDLTLGQLRRVLAWVNDPADDPTPTTAATPAATEPAVDRQPGEEG